MEENKENHAPKTKGPKPWVKNHEPEAMVQTIGELTQSHYFILFYFIWFKYDKLYIHREREYRTFQVNYYETKF